MTKYNLQTIRELLSEAFSSGEITTLAFDLFHEIYEEFTSGMSRSQKIRMVVDRASKTGRIPEMLAYVQRQNAYQYGRYANQLTAPSPFAAPAALPAANHPAPSNRRLKREKAQLESQSELFAEKVRRLRDALAIETDVARKFQLEKQLEEAAAELNEVDDRLDEIEAKLGVA